MGNYFAFFHYETGDMAIRDKEGRFQIAGRMDDVINIAGHRISTAEIEDCVSTHSSVSESAVISIPHDIKGTDSQTVTDLTVVLTVLHYDSFEPFTF